MKKISVIVPLFNAEKFIYRCLDSLTSYKNDDIEIILVDDGSTDGSGTVCDLYASKDARIKVLHQENAGVSQARNAGIALATGEYITFVDADDFVASNYFVSLKEMLTDADLVIFNLFSQKKSKFLSESLPIEDGVYNNINKLYKFCFDSYLFFDSCVNKIYKNSIIKENNLIFNKNLTICEDKEFNLNYIEKISNYAVYNVPLYHHASNKLSLSKVKKLECFSNDSFLFLKEIKLIKEGKVEYNLHTLFTIYIERTLKHYKNLRKQKYKRKDLIKIINDLAYSTVMLDYNYSGLKNKFKKLKLKYLLKNNMLLYGIAGLLLRTVDCAKKIKKSLKNTRKSIIKKCSKISLKICKVLAFLYTKFANLFIDKNKVLFISFDGLSYSDNPKAVSEMLHELRPKTKIVWLFNNPEEIKNKVPKYIKVKKKTKINLIKQLATSAVWIDNDCLVYKKRIKKHKKQLFIETWHGDRGLKKCFFDTWGYKKAEPFSLEYDGYCDYFLTGSTFAEKTVRSMFKYNGKLLPCGYPRNDILFNATSKKCAEIRNRLGVEDDVKILLYAPTFRGKLNEGSAINDIDFKRLMSTLETRDGKKWVVVLRMHHRGKGIGSEIQTINGNEGFDMSELLLVSDMLITDYSSSLGDFAITKRELILYCTDYKDYKTKDRGLHFDLEKECFLLAQNNDELNDIVKNLNEDKAKQNCEEILKLYGCYENGTAAKQVCEIIIQKLDKKKGK